MRLPAILFLLLFGMLAGPVLGLLNPDDLFGDLLFPLVSLSVAVILFEGSLTLRFSELAGVGSTVRNLVTIGALVTWAITSLLVHKLIGFDYKLSILFGAVVVVTGPTVIVPMLRTVRPNKRIADILRWEGIVIDPLGALMAVLAFNFYISTQMGDAAESILQLFLVIVAVGVVLGGIAGFGLGAMLKRYLIPDYLRSPLTLLLVFVVFAVAELLEHESGLLAVTVFDGMIVLPSLRPYEVNRVRLEPDDLPLGVAVKSIDIEVIPGYRSGSVVRFNVSNARSVRFRARMLDGTPLAEGSIGRVAGRKDILFIGLDGTGYLSELAESIDVDMQLVTGPCHLSIPLPATTSHQFVDLGELTCWPID